MLYTEGCPHVDLARERITHVLERLGLDVVPTERLVRSDAEAATTGFRGSPTILVDGTDPFPAERTAGLSCRLYPTNVGLQGAPTVEQLLGVLGR